MVEAALRPYKVPEAVEVRAVCVVSYHLLTVKTSTWAYYLRSTVCGRFDRVVVRRVRKAEW